MFLVKRVTIFLLAVMSFGLNAQTNDARTVLIQNQSYTFDVYSSPNIPGLTDSPAHGSYSLAYISPGNFSITYTPDANYVGFDEFTLEIYQNPTTYGYETYRFEMVNSIVTTKDDYGFTYMNGSEGASVLLNDYASHPPLTLKNVTFSEGGSVTTNNGIVTFVPDAGYTGMAQIKYTACDTLGTCATGMYTVSVFDGDPINGEISLGTTRETPVKTPLDWPSYVINQQPSYGHAVINDLQELVYTPNPGYYGDDYFTINTLVNSVQTTKEIHVKVYNKPAPNAIAIEDLFYTSVNSPVTFNVLDNDYGNYYMTGFSQPQAGTLVYNGSGEFTFTPPNNYAGGVSFSYNVGNMYNPSIETATVGLSIGNQAPSKGTFDLTTTSNGALIIKYPVSFLDYGFEVVNEPNSGILEFLEGQQTININGEDVSGYNMLVYWPNEGFLGIDEFDINYCLASNGECEEVKVTVDVIDVPTTCYTDCIWPGDVNADGVVSVKDILPIGLFFGEVGIERADNSTDWYAHSGENWNNPYSDIDLKFVDTDGDGQITSADTSAISLAYAKNDNLTPNIPATKKQISISFGTPSIANPQPGDFVSIPLILGTEYFPAVDIYGFTFNLNYWVDAMDNEFISFDEDSWLTQNDAVLSMAHKPYNGRLEAALTRTGKLASSGEGIIGTLNFIIDDQIDGYKLNDGKIDISITGGEVSNSTGQSFSINSGSTQLQINLAGTGLVELDPSQVILYPNPADEDINIHLNGGFKATEIEILDMHGRMIFNIKGLDTNDYQLSLRDLTSGMYIAKVITLDGIVNKKFNVSKDY